MGVNFFGMASGLPPNLVDQLVEVEKIPIQTQQMKKSKVEAKLNLVNQLDEKVRKVKGTIGTLASARGFTALSLDTSNPAIVQGTLDPNTSVRGNWNIEVVKLAEKAAAITNGFPDKTTTEIGVGYFSFETKEGTKEVYISGASSTLEGAAKAINRADVGILATVIQDKQDEDNPFKLMLSSRNVGDENKVEYPTLYFLDGDQDIYFNEERSASNGVVKIDGFEVEVADNKVEDLIPGVTLDLKQAAPGTTVNVGVKEDREVVSGKIKEFVDSVNEVLGFIQTQNKLTEKTDTSKSLGGDVLLRTVEQRMRQLLQSTVYGTGSSFSMLNEIGISFNRGGTLDFDQQKFDKVLAESPKDVELFLSGEEFGTGFIAKLRTSIGGLVDNAFGPISNRKRGLENQVDQADRRIENLERLVAQKEKSLKRKFANLEEKMSGIQSQAAMLGGGGGAPMPG